VLFDRLAWRVYLVSEERHHPTWHTAISYVAVSFLSFAKYLYDRINRHHKKKQQQRYEPDSVQPRITLTEGD
jgi:hypothetical protein